MSVWYWVACPACKQTISATTIPALENNIAYHAFGHVKHDGMSEAETREIIVKMLKHVYELATEVGEPEKFTASSTLIFQELMKEYGDNTLRQ